MSKTAQLIEKILVTFVEAAGAYYLTVTNPQAGKTAIAGAIGAGLSAVYNVLRQSQPTIVSPTVAPGTYTTSVGITSPTVTPPTPQV